MDNRFQESRHIGRIPIRPSLDSLFALGIDFKLFLIGWAQKAVMHQAAHTKSPCVKRPTTRDHRGPNTLSAYSANQRLQGCFNTLRCWALKECVIGAEIYENRAFTRFRWLSVEIIEEKFSEKVIHNMFNHASFAR